MQRAGLLIKGLSTNIKKMWIMWIKKRISKKKVDKLQ